MVCASRVPQLRVRGGSQLLVLCKCELKLEPDLLSCIAELQIGDVEREKKKISPKEISASKAFS